MTTMFDQIDIEKLVPEERLQLLEMLVKRTLRDEKVDIPDWHLDILRRRTEQFECNGSSGRSWNVVKQELLKRFQ